MYHKKSEKGQALVIIALAAVGLFAFTALAIDGSRVFSDRRHAQNAADTAVLAAALAKIRTPDYPPNAPDAPNLAAIAAGKDRAESNGYVTDVTDADPTVEVRFCDEVLSLGLTPPCEGVPPTADRSEYIQVVIKLTTNTTFARIIGRKTVPSIVTAIARAKPGTDEPFMDGVALAAMSPDAPDAITGGGNFSLDINNSGLFDNSNNSCAFSTNGSAGTYTVDTAFNVVGQYCQHSGLITLTGPLNEGASSQPYPPDIDIPAPSITCSVPGIYNGVTKTFSPGNYGQIQIPGGASTYTFEPGNYCFTAGINVGGNNTIVANNANFLFTGGDFQITSGNLTCTNLLVYTTGTSSGIHLGSNGTSNHCEGVTFYVQKGDVDLGGNATNYYTAPTSGDYQGLLIYLPFGNGETVAIGGNAFSQFTGSIIAVDSHIQIVGNTETLALSTAIIGETVQLTGNGTIVINYNPSEQYAVGDPHAISLIE